MRKKIAARRWFPRANVFVTLIVLAIYALLFYAVWPQDGPRDPAPAYTSPAYTAPWPSRDDLFYAP